MNLLSLIFAQIYFPTYSNGLKAVAGWLGFKWSSSESSGVQAIYWRENWQRCNGHAFKRELVRYNSEDCTALAIVSQTIARATSLEKDGPRDGVRLCTGGKPKTRSSQPLPRIREPDSRIHADDETAHWCRQRGELRLASRKKKRHAALLTKRYLRPVERQQFVDFLRRCPRCGTTACNKQRLRTRVCDELLFGRASLKVRRIRTVFQVYFCRRCRRHFGTPGHRNVCRRYGWNLCAFFLYLIIEVNVPQFTTVALLNRLFGIGAYRTSMHTVKKQCAGYYRDTYQLIRERILRSHVIHVDETKANVQGKAGYVWVLTSLEDVYYMYSDTREGGMIQDLLSSFKGVLVSDFYSVYETVSLRAAEMPNPSGS